MFNLKKCSVLSIISFCTGKRAILFYLKDFISDSETEDDPLRDPIINEKDDSMVRNVW